MAATVSMSKGVFTFKRPKRKGKDARKPVCANFWSSSSENEKLSAYAFSNYRESWNQIFSLLKTLQDETHGKVFKELIGFLKMARSRNQGHVYAEDIPAACLVTGGNMPDREAVFDSLVHLVKMEVTTYMAKLQSRDCTTIRNAIIALVTQVMGSTVSDEDEDDVTLSKMDLKRANCTLATLKAWFEELQSSRCFESPSKKRKSGGKVDTSLCATSVKPIVIILEDVESFPKNVLQDLILICRSYGKVLPFVFVFGVATSPGAIHQCLTQRVSANLAIETFQAQPSTFYLNHVIEQVLMNAEIPYHIGGRVYKLLLDAFLFHDLSVENFCRGFQFSMVQHFTNNLESALCCLPDVRKERIKTFTTQDLDVFRKLQSFRTYVEKQPPKSQVDLLTNDDVCKETVLKLLESVDNWYAGFVVMVKVIHTMTCDLPSSPLGRQVREVFALCLSQSVTKTEEFKECWKLLNQLAREELLPLLKKVLTIVDEKTSDEHLIVLCMELSKAVENLEELGHYEANVPVQDPVFTLKPTDRFQLKEKLQELAKLKGQKSKGYEGIRNTALAALEAAVAHFLNPPSSLPLSEVSFFQSSSSMKPHLVSVPRASITTALSNPSQYLQCECCMISKPGMLTSTMPDLCVIYKLHLECGRYINLYDWLQAYLAVMEQEDSPSKKKEDQNLQARFVQAIAELQLLGFIKPTKRKTDHVARLTWGGC